MIKRLYNIWFKRKTKNFTRIPVFVMTFDWNKFQKGGKENSCMLYTLHPDIAKDEFLKEKLSECVDYIRDNYDMEMFTKFQWEEFQVNGVEKTKRILELEKENKRLAAKNKELEEKLEKANSIVMAYTNELQTREVIKGVWETQLPLISSPI